MGSNKSKQQPEEEDAETSPTPNPTTHQQNQYQNQQQQPNQQQQQKPSKPVYEEDNPYQFEQDASPKTQKQHINQHQPAHNTQQQQQPHVKFQQPGGNGGRSTNANLMGSADGPSSGLLTVGGANGTASRGAPTKGGGGGGGAGAGFAMDAIDDPNVPIPLAVLQEDEKKRKYITQLKALQDDMALFDKPYNDNYVTNRAALIASNAQHKRTKIGGGSGKDSTSFVNNVLANGDSVAASSSRGLNATPHSGIAPNNALQYVDAQWDDEVAMRSTVPGEQGYHFVNNRLVLKPQTCVGPKANVEPQLPPDYSQFGGASQLQYSQSQIYSDPERRGGGGGGGDGGASGQQRQLQSEAKRPVGYVVKTKADIIQEHMDIYRNVDVKNMDVHRENHEFSVVRFPPAAKYDGPRQQQQQQLPPPSKNPYSPFGGGGSQTLSDADYLSL